MIANYNKLDQKSRPNEPMVHFKAICDHYNSRISKLIYFIYDQGFSATVVADLLGITRQTLSQKYPIRKDVEEVICER